MDKEQLKQELTEKLKQIREQIVEVRHSDETSNEVLWNKLDKLHEEYLKISDNLYFLDCQISIGNEVVDLYKKEADYLYGDYTICLHNTQTIVGSITYRPDGHMGNIGYTIKNSYRGNNYAYHAASVLLNFLKEHDITECSIWAYSDNTPSIRTMEKLKESHFECEITNPVDGYDIVSYSYKLNLAIKKGKK